MRSFKKTVVSLGATVMAGAVILGMGAAPAMAVSGEIHNSRIIARWEYTPTQSAASSRTLLSGDHYAYAQQDSKYALSNAGPEADAQAYVSGKAWNTRDYAGAGYGSRSADDFERFR
ncbi:hypothetical protein [Bifidobacterium vespertilionis]|uniref:hypothetical protein n=1 Tax=Bifidobacterium vespertilionis TaxID=2562524 RepID=UPI001BDBC6D8|nr:hypothetical protein [Bifidobacterium vespertilionis]MBT1179821.1 hypothetical protein [Bifidobacterium vespertilionis]